LIFVAGRALPAGSGDRDMLTLSHRCCQCGFVERIPRARPGPYVDNQNRGTKTRPSGGLKRWQRAIATEAKLYLWDPLTGGEVLPIFGKYVPVCITMISYREQIKANRLAPSTKPDVDKLARAALDALTGIIYVDDGQVTDLIKLKRYCDLEHPRPGVWIEWAELTAADM
jgi:Holliday junction resolvase RusA-like endonuclease